MLAVTAVGGAAACDRTPARRPLQTAAHDAAAPRPPETAAPRRQPETAALAAAAPRAPFDAFEARVDRVVDGDTIIARRPRGGPIRVRIIGIDSPETKLSPAGEQCHGPQASAYADGVLAGRAIRAAFEGTAHRDRFGRELWHVWLPDGAFFAGRSVELGHARALRVRPHLQHAAYLSAKQDEAAQARRGLWARCPQ